MGDIEENLGVAFLGAECICSNRLVVEQCENFHIHYRDLRLEFDEDTFSIFCNTATEAWAAFEEDPQKGDTMFFRELSKEFVQSFSTGHNIFKIELLKNGVIHIHYRNIRLELDQDAFRLLTHTFLTAYSRFTVQKHTGRCDIENPRHDKEMSVPIEHVNQYDIGHRYNPASASGFLCWNEHEIQEHEKGIQLCMSLLEAGYNMLPIAICWINERDVEYSGEIQKEHRFQRLDGFKRFEAYKRLGYKKIPCYLYSGKNVYPGNQRYMPWVLP